MILSKKSAVITLLTLSFLAAPLASYGSKLYYDPKGKQLYIDPTHRKDLSEPKKGVQTYEWEKHGMADPHPSPKNRELMRLHQENMEQRAKPAIRLQTEKKREDVYFCPGGCSKVWDPASGRYISP